MTRRAKVVISILHTLTLRGHEGECRALVAPRYASAAERVPAERSLEELGVGLLLRMCAGVTCDEDLSWGVRGKPALAGAVVPGTNDEPGMDAAPARLPVSGTPRISISHDAGMVALALCPDAEVGVDLARIGFDARVARRVFGDEAAKALGDGSTVGERTAFSCAWAELEATLKGIGTGFAADFRRHPELLDGWLHETRVIMGDGSLRTPPAVAEKDLAPGGPRETLGLTACLSCACRVPFDLEVRWEDERVLALFARGL